MNKFYIQIVFFLLIIALYLNNKTLATELVPKKDRKHKSKKFTIFNSKKYYPVNDNTQEIYEKNKHLLYTDTKETINAEKFMKEAVTHLEYHATSKYGYKLCDKFYDNRMYFYKKKHKGDTDVEKIRYTIDDPNKYNGLINRFWDPDSTNFLYKDLVKRKIVRVYGPNLVMIQQRSKRWPWSREKYFYAIAAKFKISPNKTMIVMSSANIIDHNRKNKKYFENKIIENANLFQAEIDSEDDIRNGELEKMFVNLNGYIIEKKNKHIYITYINSIVCHFINKHIFIYIFQHRNIRRFMLIKMFISMHNNRFKLPS
ncbi:fam-a protein [Plasmodium yoelii]|uniref:Fam-a protein n=1 Tax=Plasmodium yoelii TaxID=5861 RepID=A0A078KBE8_PLAYE|nr:fam-a protein [Plasmodium yoelii]CDU18698.1 fam-a protein [Plasmodium yoelii]VTZ79283.1 fam-a protein [Plasmodium yoelii]|eukprot:XP_022812319.1 fam-a protein [Plasmodium yoelii]